MKILVTGSGGQLGSELQFLKDQYSTFEFTFSDYPEMDITNKDALKAAFEQGNFDFCINCAAYTAVDKAEDSRAMYERIQAYKTTQVFHGREIRKYFKANKSKVINLTDPEHPPEGFDYGDELETGSGFEVVKD